ncbi:MAG: S8 family serine peptidase, partial [Gemmatimonadota bacterium]
MIGLAAIAVLVAFGRVAPANGQEAAAGFDDAGFGKVPASLLDAVAAVPAGQRIPVVVEFVAPGGLDGLAGEAGGVGEPEVAGVVGVVGVVGVAELRTRALNAMGGLGALAPDGDEDEDVRVTERFWVVPAVSAEVSSVGLARLAASPDVRRVVSDEPLAVVLDPSARSFAPPTFTSDAMRTIGADAVWDGGATGQGTVIAFFDSGVDAGNAMIARRWRGLRTSTRASWFDPFRRASLPQDLIGHGTQVALAAVGALSTGDTLQFADGSTLVASSNLDVVTGTAPRAEWIAARVFVNFGGGVFSRRSVLLQAYQWALDPDGNPSTDDAPDVINNSWGILPTEDFDLCTDILYSAIDAAEAAGIAVLFSAGNAGPAPGSIAFPAARNDPGLRNFAVGGSVGTTTIGVAEFSGRGPSPCGAGIKPEIIAPSTVPEVRTVGPGRVRLTGFTAQGTSFSVAQASGAVALLRQARGGASPQALKQFLIDSADDVGATGPDPDAGYGLLDVPGSLSAAGSSVFAGRSLQVAGVESDAAGLVLRVRNRGDQAWGGGTLRLERVSAGVAGTGSVAGSGGVVATGSRGTGRAAEAVLPAIPAGGVLAASLPWTAGIPSVGTPARVRVLDAEGVVLDRLVWIGPPDGFGGFVLADGSVAAGANDFGRIGRVAAPQGFVWQGVELLPAAGVAVVAGNVVSDGFYATTLGRFDLKALGPAIETDWAPQRAATDAEASTADVRFDDFEALFPAGIEVSGTYTASDSGGVGALELALIIRNRSGQPVADLVAGLMADWDLAGGESVRWSDALQALVTESRDGGGGGGGGGAGGPITVVATDTVVSSAGELPLGTPGVAGFYEAGSGVLADSLLDATKLILLRGGVFAGLPGAGSATDNAALLGAGPLAVSAGGTVSVRFWLLAAADEAAAGARLAELR